MRDNVKTGKVNKRLFSASGNRCIVNVRETDEHDCPYRTFALFELRTKGIGDSVVILAELYLLLGRSERDRGIAAQRIVA